MDKTFSYKWFQSRMNNVLDICHLNFLLNFFLFKYFAHFFIFIPFYFLL